MTCLLCSNAALRGLSMQDKASLRQAAQDFIQGVILTASQGSQDLIKAVRPPRRGICIVERCARTIESLCGSCLETGCHRCAIAAELRAAEDRINHERDVELAVLGFDDKDLESFVIDKVAGGLCEKHGAFGSALLEQWYARQSFARADERP